MTDCLRILQLLQERGEKGLHSFEIVQLVHTIRGAARIHDLKKQGYKITSIPESRGNAVGVRYFLQEQVRSKGYWRFKDKAEWVENEEPKQLGLI